MALGDQAGLAAADKIIAIIPGIEGWGTAEVDSLRATVTQILTEETVIVNQISTEIAGLKAFVTSERQTLFADLDQRANAFREMVLRAVTIPKPPA